MAVVSLASNAHAYDRTTGSSDLTAAGSTGDTQGYSVLIADLDGDGQDDLISSSTEASNGAVANAGAVYVLFGPISRYSNDGASHDPEFDSDVVIHGVDVNQSLGSWLDLGDVDGDGEADMVLSAKVGNTVGYDGGEVYVFLGPFLSGEERDTDDADLVLYGVATGDHFGTEVAVADLDLDGYDDIVVGAPDDDSNGSGAGAVFVFFGAASLPTGPLSGTSADRVYLGDAGDRAGFSVAAGPFMKEPADTGEVGVVVGAPSAHNDRGSVFVFPEVDTAVSDELTDFAVEIVGNTSEQLGFRVALVGDVLHPGDDGLELGASTGQSRLFYLFNSATGYWNTISGISSYTDAAASFLADDHWGDTVVVPARRYGNLSRADDNDDLVLSDYSAKAGGTDRGAVYVFYHAAFSGSYNLTAADYALYDTGSHDWFGFSHALGDVNADGVADLFAGEPHNGSTSGASHLFYGPFDALSGTHSLAASDSYQPGEDMFDSAGLAVHGVGDINCDGIPDFGVGAGLAAESTTQTGALYLFFGPDSHSRVYDLDSDGDPTNNPHAVTWMGSTVDLGDADAVYWGEAASDAAGSAFAGVGDVSGDGCDDLLVGAPGNDDGGTDAGAVYLLVGSADLSGSLHDTDTVYELHGSNAGDRLGMAVAGVGDANGDGYNDFAIGAPYWDYTWGGLTSYDVGIVYLIAGRSSWATTPRICSYRGHNDDDRAGWSIAGPIDFDDDGYLDLAVGAPGHDSGLGAVFVAGGVSCSQTGINPLAVGLSSGLTLEGRFAGGEFGRKVDVTDGEHLLVGAPLTVVPGFSFQTGEAHWIPGQAISGTQTAPAGGVPICYPTPNKLARLGKSVGAGDVNGDEVDDLLVGAPDHAVGSAGKAGKVYLFDGATVQAAAPYTTSSCWDADSNAQAILQGEYADDLAGDASDISGDLNQDGEADILVGATWNDGGGSYSGAAYTILSSHQD